MSTFVLPDRTVVHEALSGNIEITADDVTIVLQRADLPDLLDFLHSRTAIREMSRFTYR